MEAIWVSINRWMDKEDVVYIYNRRLLLLLLLSHFSRVWLCATPWTAAHQAPLSLGFSRQEHWSGLPFPSPMRESEQWKWSRSVVSDSLQLHGPQPTRLLCPWDFPGKSTGVGCHCLLQIFMLVSSRPTFTNLPFFSCKLTISLWETVSIFLPKFSRKLLIDSYSRSCSWRRIE